ncbi:MAG: hypothetical protein ACR2IS_09135, partial [Nitrososphaeraceae archaeon]
VVICWIMHHGVIASSPNSSGYPRALCSPTPRLKYFGALNRQDGSLRTSARHRTRWLVLAFHSAPAGSCRT